MKKTILFFCVCVGTALASNGQVIDAAQVPHTIKTTFEKRYPGVVPQWEYEEGKFDAEFKKDGKKMEVLFDRQGNSAQKIELSDVPQAAVDYVSKQYQGEKIKKMKRLINASGSTSYQLLVKSKNLFFDADGKFLKEEAMM